MKKFLMNKAVSLIKKNNPDYDDEKIAVIIYGLEGIYISVTKLFIITIVSIILGIFREFLIVLLLFNVVRTTGFGLHASKSIICLISSTLIFIITPIICSLLILPPYVKLILGVVCIIMFFLYAPSDTAKRPIVSKKRRLAYKYITVSIAITYTIIAMIIKDNFISNAFIFGMMIEVFMIHPLVYKLFNMSYDNYKNFQYNQ